MLVQGSMGHVDYGCDTISSRIMAYEKVPKLWALLQIKWIKLRSYCALAEILKFI